MVEPVLAKLVCSHRKVFRLRQDSEMPWMSLSLDSSRVTVFYLHGELGKGQGCSGFINFGY